MLTALQPSHVQSCMPYLLMSTGRAAAVEAAVAGAAFCSSAVDGLGAAVEEAAEAGCEAAVGAAEAAVGSARAADDMVGERLEMEAAGC